MTDDLPQYLDARQFAELVQMHRQTVYQKLRAEEVSHGRRRFRRHARSVGAGESRGGQSKRWAPLLTLRTHNSYECPDAQMRLEGAGTGALTKTV